MRKRKWMKSWLVVVVVLVLIGMFAVPVFASTPRTFELPSRISQWWLESLGYTCRDAGHTALDGVVCTKGGDIYYCSAFTGMCIHANPPVAR